MRFAIVRFPGTWSDRDTAHVLANVLEQEAEIVWHQETSLAGFDAVVLPGGFSYGDYLRCGAIARFSPIMEEVVRAAEEGMPVIGICNGFQMLCESGLLPGALIRNRSLRFRCEWTHLRREGGGSPWTAGIGEGEVLRIPISHGEGGRPLAARRTGARGACRVSLLRRAGRGDAGRESERERPQHRGHP